MTSTVQTLKAVLDYGQIFEQRAIAYHQAMTLEPDARRVEFETIIEFADIQPHHNIADFPAGGQYLFEYLAERGISPKEYTPLETSKIFAALHDGRPARVLASDLSDLGEGQFDRMLSLAGLHHFHPREPIYERIFRSLNSGGRFVIADVWEGSVVDRFLNQYVAANSELGHQGIFLNENDLTMLQRAGFTKIKVEHRSYEWRFTTSHCRAKFCRNLFGLSVATEAVEAAIENYFSPTNTNLPWQLAVIVAQT